MAAMADAARMVFLGFGKYARADKIYALEPLTGEERGGGRRTRVWIEGIAAPVIASRTERTILLDMGVKADAVAPVLSEALALAERLAEDAEKVGPLLARSIKAEAGLDLPELGRRARRLLESTTAASDTVPKLF